RADRQLQGRSGPYRGDHGAPPAMNASDISIAFEPLLPWWAIGALGAAGLLLLVLLWARRARGGLWRTIAVAGLLLGLANPHAVQEERQMLSDIAVVVVDDSPSQAIGERRQRTDQALEQIRNRLQGYRDLELRVVRAGATNTGEGTRLFEALDRA